MNGIQIPPEWFLESPGRNQFPESGGTESLLNRCLLIMSKSSVGVCRGSIWASSTNNSTLSQPPPSSTMPSRLAHHRRQWPPPTTTDSMDTAHNKYGTPQKSKNDAATPRHHPELANERLEHPTTVPRRGQRRGKRQTTTSVVVRRLRSG